MTVVMKVVMKVVKNPTKIITTVSIPSFICITVISCCLHYLTHVSTICTVQLHTNTLIHTHTTTHSHTYQYTHKHCETHSFTHSLRYSLTHTLTHSLNLSLTHSFTHSLTQSSYQSINQSINQSTNQSINQSLDSIHLNSPHTQPSNLPHGTHFTIKSIIASITFLYIYHIPSIYIYMTICTFINTHMYKLIFI